MGFLYGVIGAAAALLLFAAGFAVGMLFHASLHKPPRPKDGMSEAEKKQLKEQAELQKAFITLQNYSPEVAYGIRTIDEVMGGDKT